MIYVSCADNSLKASNCQYCLNICQSSFHCFIWNQIKPCLLTFFSYETRWPQFKAKFQWKYFVRPKRKYSCFVEVNDKGGSYFSSQENWGTCGPKENLKMTDDDQKENLRHWEISKRHWEIHILCVQIFEVDKWKGQFPGDSNNSTYLLIIN